MTAMPNILSPLQASVVQWLVQPGQTVAAGDVLVILEAMKMEHEVRAPAAGRVTHLCYAVGELVQEKEVLLNWELLAQAPRRLDANFLISSSNRDIGCAVPRVPQWESCSPNKHAV